jgi:DNA mismatch endonuclease (patch repair protein)
MAKLKTAVFVHGCFWHRHKNCRDNSNPSTNSAFWQAKFKRNVDRDERNKKDLRELGWRVIVVWECETRNLEKLERRLRRLLLGDSSKPGNAASRKLPFTRGEHLRAAESRASYGLAKKGKRPTKGSKSR